MKDLKEHTIQGIIFYPDRNSRDQLKMSALMRNFQQVGGAHLEAAGTSPEEMFRRNLSFILIRQEIVLLAPIGAGSYPVTTWVSGQAGVNYIRNYEIKDADGKRLAVASSAWILFDLASRRVLRPDRFESDIPYYPEKETGIADPGKFRLPEDMKVVGKVIPRYADMDSNGHVNNTVYGDFVAEAAQLLGIERPVCRQKLYFRHEVTAGESILLSAKQEDNILYVCGDVETDGRRSFEAELQFS